MGALKDLKLKIQKPKFPDDNFVEKWWLAVNGDTACRTVIILCTKLFNKADMYLNNAQRKIC